MGVELLGAFVEEGKVVRSATPSGLVAAVTRLGPYGGLGAAHGAVRDWCNTHHHAFAGPSWEVYGHWQTDWNTNPALIRTDVYYQLRMD